MNMQAYRKVIITRMVLLAALAMFAAGLGIYDAFFASGAIREHNVFAFQCGSTSALGVMALVGTGVGLGGAVAVGVAVGAACT